MKVIITNKSKYIKDATIELTKCWEEDEYDEDSNYDTIKNSIEEVQKIKEEYEVASLEEFAKLIDMFNKILIYEPRIYRYEDGFNIHLDTEDILI